jgi:hypothetical protein
MLRFAASDPQNRLQIALLAPEAGSQAKKCWRVAARNCSQFSLNSLILSSLIVAYSTGKHDSGEQSSSAVIASAFGDVL